MKSYYRTTKKLLEVRLALLLMLCSAFSPISAQIMSISSLNTGAGYYAVNNGAVIVDPNWKVTLLSTNPPGQIPPYGIPNGNAYLIPNPLFLSYVGYPLNTSWLPNDATSTWITYSTPTQLGGDTTVETFQYQLAFQAVTSGVIGINFLSDNTDNLYVNGNYIGSNPAQYGIWLSTPFYVSLTAGSIYVVDFDVLNTALAYDNPTGARVEFSGNVNVTSVPEPESAALLCVGLLGLLTFLRRRHKKTPTHL